LAQALHFDRSTGDGGCQNGERRAGFQPFQFGTSQIGIEANPGAV